MNIAISPGAGQVYADVEARIQRGIRRREVAAREPVEVGSYQRTQTRTVGDPLARWSLAVLKAERVWGEMRS